MWPLQCILNIHITIKKYKVIGFAVCSLIHRVFDYIFLVQKVSTSVDYTPVSVLEACMPSVCGRAVDNWYAFILHICYSKALAVCLVLIYSKYSLQNSLKNHKIIHKKTRDQETIHLI